MPNSNKSLEVQAYVFCKIPIEWHQSQNFFSYGGKMEKYEQQQ